MARNIVTHGEFNRDFKLKAQKPSSNTMSRFSESESEQGPSHEVGKSHSENIMMWWRGGTVTVAAGADSEARGDRGRVPERAPGTSNFSFKLTWKTQKLVGTRWVLVVDLVTGLELGLARHSERARARGEGVEELQRGPMVGSLRQARVVEGTPSPSRSAFGHTVSP